MASGQPQRRDISAAVDKHCPACRGEGRPLSLLVEGEYVLVQCLSCSTQYLRQEPSSDRSEEEATQSLYWEEYKFDLYSREDVRQEFEARHDRALLLAQEAAGPIRSVLDVGCGIGNFVEYAGRRGLQAHGCDVSAEAVETARRRGLSVWTPEELEGVVPDSSMDALTLWDVVEHVFQPRDMVAEALRKLRGGAAVLLETPDARFPVRGLALDIHRLTRSRVDLTGHFYYWEHKIYFTLEGLNQLLDSVGVDVVSSYALTSPRSKMHAMFKHQAQQERSIAANLLARAWPALEAATRRVARGNKLVVIGRKRE